jgi:type IV pilus assembly protein PilM
LANGYLRKEFDLRADNILKTTGKGILAIDIGTTAIKYVKFEGGRVVDYGIKEIAEIFDIPSILKEITKSSAPSQIYSFVSGPAVSIRQAPFPKMGQRELRDAILLRLDKYSPFTLDESILDFTVISDIREAGIIRDNVMVVAARRDVVSEHIATFRKAGLEPTAISVIPFALAAAAKRFARIRVDEVVCMIDIGAQFVNILFIRNQKLDLTRTITVAGNALTEAMTVVMATEGGELALNVTEAEEIKKQYGIPSADTQEKLPNGISIRNLLTLQEPTLTRMIAEINRSIDYYRREFTIPKIDRLILCGGGAITKNLREYMESNIGIPTEIFDPFRMHNLYRRDRPFAEGLGTRLVGALGLLFDPTAVDLLPKEIKIARVRKTDVARVVVLAIFIVPVLIIINLMLSFRANIRKRDVEVYQKRLKTLELVNADYDDYQVEISDLEAKLKTLQNTVGAESMTLPVLRQLSYIIPANIQIQSFFYTKDKTIKITGILTDRPFLLDLDLTQFMIQLETSSLFRNVKLVSKNRTVLYGADVLNFEINCTVQ